MRVVIYRRDVKGAKPKLSVTAMREAERRMDIKCRVRRPSLEAFLKDGFYNLEALPPGTVFSQSARMLDHEGTGWEIPTDSLGRNADQEPTQSTANSILLWIKNNCGHLVNADQVSVVIEP